MVMAKSTIAEVEVRAPDVRRRVSGVAPKVGAGHRKDVADRRGDGGMVLRPECVPEEFRSSSGRGLRDSTSGSLIFLHPLKELEVEGLQFAGPFNQLAVLRTNTEKANAEKSCAQDE